MLILLMANIDSIQEQIDNVSKKVGILRNNKDMLEVKKKSNKEKTFDRLISRL